MNFRGTSNDLSSVKIFTNENSFQIEKQISFDSECKQISSLEFFGGSVLSSIILTLLEHSKKRDSIIEEIEGVLNLSLENPLSLVGVKGYDEEPIIRKITVTVFLFVDLEDNDFDDFCFRALNNSPIYNTLKNQWNLKSYLKSLYEIPYSTDADYVEFLIYNKRFPLRFSVEIKIVQKSVRKKPANPIKSTFEKKVWSEKVILTHKKRVILKQEWAKSNF